MMHKMNLWEDEFEKIKEKTKSIEMRLNDKKRSYIKIDDIIEFTNLSSGEKIRCLVTDLFKYSNFKELYKQHNKVLIGYGEDEEANPSDMLKYYPKEDVERFGVIGIEIKVI